MPGSLLISCSDERRLCEGCLSIDVQRWHRDSLLQPGHTFSWTWSCGGEQLGSIGVSVEAEALLLTFQWRSRGISEWTPGRQRVLLRWTPCHLGGAGPWFRCPGRGRRVAKLYTDDSHLFACRLCRGLAYASQSQTRRERAISQAEKLRMRLGGSANILDPVPDKPPRMCARLLSDGCRRNSFTAAGKHRI